MSDQIEERLRRARGELRPSRESEERALRAALAELPSLASARRAAPRRRRIALLAAPALAAVAVAGAVWAALDTGSSAPSVLAIPGGSARFPSETFTDWVSYADQVSIVTAVAEEALPPDVIEPGDSYVPRTVTLRVDSTIWRREGAPAAEGAVRVLTYGWALENGERRPVTAWGGPRLEVGARYAMPLVRAPRDGVDWTPLALDATLPLEGSLFTTAGISGRPAPIANELSGKSPDELAAILSRTRPDPVAARYFDRSPDERWEAVLRERRAE